MIEIITAKDAANMIKENSRILFGGFLAVGVTENIIDELKNKGTKKLHLVSISTDFDDRGCGILVTNKQVKSAQVSHIGTNKATQAQYNAKELDIEFIPQGTLMERVRAAGAGLGGVLTPTGIGTVVEEGKQIITVKEKKYILEEPIYGDFALIRAKKADKSGNLTFDKTMRNSNPIMAMAAGVTIVECDEIVEIGEIKADDIHCPGIFVNYLVLHK